MHNYKTVVINFDNDLHLKINCKNEIPDKDCILLIIRNLNDSKYENINSIKIVKGYIK